MNDETRQINAALDEINKHLARYKLAYVRIEDLAEIDRNARFMNYDKFNALFENVKKDQQLGSVPLCLKDGDRFEVLSGNHRVAAAKKAGLSHAVVLYVTDLTLSQKRAIQLSHNAIEGEDDLQILKGLIAEIGNLDDLIYSGLSPESVISDNFQTVSDAPISYKVHSFAFLPEQAEYLAQVLDKVGAVSKDDETYLMRLKDYDVFAGAIKSVKAGMDVKNNTVALLKCLDIAGEEMKVVMGNSRKKGWVSLVKIFGTTAVPPEVAELIESVLEQFLKDGVVKKSNRWQVLEYLVADHLAGKRGG